MTVASSDRFHYLQQVKHYNCLIKSLESSLRNTATTFGPDNEQTRFCREMLQETMREAALIGVACVPREQVDDETMHVDVGHHRQPESAVGGDDDDDDVVMMAALQELRDRMASVKIA